MPELVIGDERFQCRDSLPPFRLMELASGVSSDEPLRQAGAMYDFVMAVVLEADRGRFKETMRSLDDDPDVIEKLNQAIGDLMVSYTDRPTERPSRLPRSSGASGRPSSPGSSSPGTARVVNLSSKAGRSAAS